MAPYLQFAMAGRRLEVQPIQRGLAMSALQSAWRSGAQAPSWRLVEGPGRPTSGWAAVVGQLAGDKNDHRGGSAWCWRASCRFATHPSVGAWIRMLKITTA